MGVRGVGGFQVESESEFSLAIKSELGVERKLSNSGLQKIIEKGEAKFT